MPAETPDDWLTSPQPDETVGPYVVRGSHLRANVTRDGEHARFEGGGHRGDSAFDRAVRWAHGAHEHEMMVGRSEAGLG